MPPAYRRLLATALSLSPHPHVLPCSLLACASAGLLQSLTLLVCLSFTPQGADIPTSEGFDVGRMRRLVHNLDNPQSKFKAVHIAGTKGKGSTATFLSSILRVEGYSVGCYCSQHIRTIRERITLGTIGDLCR